jgi:hypothetical protein
MNCGLVVCLAQQRNPEMWWYGHPWVIQSKEAIRDFSEFEYGGFGTYCAVVMD